MPPLQPSDYAVANFYAAADGLQVYNHGAHDYSNSRFFNNGIPASGLQLHGHVSEGGYNDSSDEEDTEHEEVPTGEPFCISFRLGTLDNILTHGYTSCCYV
jgi:hypothetical protein